MIRLGYHRDCLLLNCFGCCLYLCDSDYISIFSVIQEGYLFLIQIRKLHPHNEANCYDAHSHNIVVVLTLGLLINCLQPTPVWLQKSSTVGRGFWQFTVPNPENSVAYWVVGQSCCWALMHCFCPIGGPPNSKAHWSVNPCKVLWEYVFSSRSTCQLYPSSYVTFGVQQSGIPNWDIFTDFCCSFERQFNQIQP